MSKRFDSIELCPERTGSNFYRILFIQEDGYFVYLTKYSSFTEKCDSREFNSRRNAIRAIRSMKEAKGCILIDFTYHIYDDCKPKGRII
jgi:hypothetical protein